MRRGLWCAAAVVLLASVCGPVPAAQATAAPPADAQVRTPSEGTAPGASGVGKAAFDRFLGTGWHGVYMLGKKIGWMKSTFSKSADGRRYESASLLHARFQMLGVEQVMELKEKRSYSGPDWRLTRIEMSHTVGDRSSRMVGRAKGEVFEFTRELAGKLTTQDLPLPVESLTDAFRAETLALDPKTALGTGVPFRQFDPSTGREYHCEVTLRAREKMVLEGVETTVVTLDVLIKEMGVRSLAKVTSDGLLLETTVGAMFVVRRESEAVAKRLDIPLDALAAAAIRLNRELPDVTALSELVLLISGLNGEQSLVRSDRQTFEPTGSPGVYRLTLKQGRWPPDETVTAPYDREKFKDALAATPFVQSDDPRIVNLAKQILGRETHPKKRVKKLVNWVDKNVKTRYSAAFSTALDVVQTRSGDCSEHTILFVALCRAAGIPAEEVSGVMYVQGFGRFAYHAWARVYVGKWVEVDPTWNRTVIHPAYIAFAVGPLEKQVAIVNLVGRVKLRYVGQK